MLSLRALTALPAAAILQIAASPVTIAVAAGTSTVKDPYGETKPINVDGVGAGHAATSGSTGGSLARTILGLAVVIAVIYGLTWVLRQMKASKQDNGGFGHLTAESTVQLAPGRAVHLVRVGRELVLVGSAEQGVTPIRTYTEDEAIDLGLIGDPDDDGGDDSTVSSNRVSRPVASSALRPMVRRLRELTLR